MMKGKTEENVIYREYLSEGCELVITRKDWNVQFGTAGTEKDRYLVESDKIPEFLGDLKKNLNLYLEMKEAGQPHTKDGDGVRNMTLKFHEDKPGVYLQDTYWIASSLADYNQVETLMKKAVDRANKINETL
jgi:hypothetical protein